MSWIKENTFLAGLVIVTVVLAAVLYVFGSSGASRFEEAQQTYESASSETANFERSKLYPTRENLDGKKAALEEYLEEAKELQMAFDRFRAEEEVMSISPQEFSDNLKQAVEETRDAFGNEVILPEAYYLGFEGYATGNVASGKATGVLNYQLQATEALMLKLAESGVTELINIHRPALPEERGKEFQAESNQVARGLPIEISFQGPESAVRDFISTLGSMDEHYVVIRSLRIRNMKQNPPRTSDVTFESPDEKAPDGAAGFFSAAPTPGDLFADAIEPADGDAAAEPTEPEPAPPFAPEATRDSSRNLAQVLGDEELRVFLRLDLKRKLRD